MSTITTARGTEYDAMFCVGSGQVHAAHIGDRFAVCRPTTSLCGLPMAPATRLHEQSEKPITCKACLEAAV